MKTEIKLITKEVAEEILKGNLHNRKPNLDHVSSLASHMTNCNWKASGDPIRISKTGRLLDGQHRLMALVKCAVPQKMLIVSDLEDEVFDVIDTGKMRNASDIFHIANINNANTMSAIVKIVKAYESGIDITNNSGAIALRKYLSPAHLIEEYNSRPEYYEELLKSASKHWSNSKILKPSEYALINHIFSKINSSNSEEFLDKLSTGSMLDVDDPIFLLRKRLIDYKAGRLRVHFKLKLGLTYLAWNHFRKGNSIKFLRFGVNDELPKLI